MSSLPLLSAQRDYIQARSLDKDTAVAIELPADSPAASKETDICTRFLHGIPGWVERGEGGCINVRLLFCAFSILQFLVFFYTGSRAWVNAFRRIEEGGDFWVLCPYVGEGACRKVWALFA